MTKPKQIKLDDIKIDGNTQSRVKINEAVVQDYCEVVIEGGTLPPVDVCHDGSTYWLYDGFHRLLGHNKAGVLVIDCNVIRGTQEDAQWLSYAANQTHGLRRSNEDKRRAAINALKHPKGVTLSDSAIAEHVGVHHETVAKYRAELESTCEIRKSSERVGKDGRTINTTNIGKKSEARKTNPPSETSTADEYDWGTEEPAEPKETVVDGVAWVETEDDQKATLSDDDWNDAEAELKVEKDRKNHARGYLKAAHKSLAALQENCLNASRLQAKIDLKVVDNHAKSLYSLVEKARTSL